MPRRHQQGGGRIYPHEREADDGTPLLGENIQDLGAAFQKNYNETVALSLEDRTRKDYRRRLTRIADFWEANYPDYYSLGVRQVDQDEGCDPTKFFYNSLYQRDLIYKGLNVKFVVGFLMANEKKENGKLKSFTDIRKYKDAILWGSSIANVPLPRSFYREIEVYLTAFKKKVVSARKKGEVDDTGADPIPEQLYELLLQWAIEEGNMMVWFWTQTQWNFMARLANVAGSSSGLSQLPCWA